MSESFRRYSEVLIVGCGYTGKRLASSLQAKGSKVTALTKNSAIDIDGVKSVQIDLDQAQPAQLSIATNALIFYLVPPPIQCEIDARIRQFLENVLIGSPARFILISTTGVYGNCHGSWIDEKTPVNPESIRAKKRLDAENYATRWSKNSGVELTILRVAGIYGPDRIPVRRLKQGFVLPKKDKVGYTNRIHVEDLVRICMSASEHESGDLFNVADGCPLRMNEYYNFVAEVWGLPPVAESSDPSKLEHLSSAMWSFIRASKKIDNRYLLKTLEMTLLYPHPKLGLQACYVDQASKSCFGN